MATEKVIFALIFLFDLLSDLKTSVKKKKVALNVSDSSFPFMLEYLNYKAFGILSN